MRTIETVVYKFDELSENAKKKAIAELADINVDCNWYEFIYEDAKNIGLKITSFDIDRANYCKAEFIDGAEICANLIIANHGETCDSHNTTKKFLEDIQKAIKENADRMYVYGVPALTTEDDVRDNFLRAISEDYLSMLKKEYEYQTSEEAIINTIKTNDYEFTEDGKLYNENKVH